MEIQKFQFTNYEVPIEIGGSKFSLDCSSETGDYLKRCGNELRQLAAEIESGEKTADDAIEYGLKMLDTLLGAGASEKVFAGRRKRLSDVTDICIWLTEIAEKFQQERIKTHQNRAQRRASAKTK